MNNQPPPDLLTVDRLDELGALSFAGQVMDGRAFTTAELGAYLEWNWLRAAGNQLGTLTRTQPFVELHSRMRSGLTRWTTSTAPARGFIRVRRDHANVEDAAWTQFRYDLQRSAIQAGFAPTWAKQVVGAVGELEDNVHWHSMDPASGLLAYWIDSASVEIVVLDRGIGVLESLQQCDEFADLTDSGTALEIALQDGKTRYGSSSGRGWGFHNLFVGLTDRSARIRFRSGDHLLTLDGTTDLPSAHLRQSASGQGFLVSVLVPAAPC